jgi:LAO/AO transport system kinase
MSGAPTWAQITPAELAAGIRAGDRAMVSRAITLVESRHVGHRERAMALVAALTASAAAADAEFRSSRIGISGVPGVGKSTFIDALGLRLIEDGHRVAVLAVDPSSRRTGGSILGDRTRMSRLAASPHAFVRPSPSGGTLGGVARTTRESMFVMEAAGYDVVLVETVGVGQSEYVVADMVDTFLLLALARTGDQLQGMKRGILELADVIAVNKADGENAAESERAARELSGALRLVRGEPGGWQPPVVTSSGLAAGGLELVARQLARHRAHLIERDLLLSKRRAQLVEWTRSMVRDELLAALSAPDVAADIEVIEADVRGGGRSAEQGAADIVARLRARPGPDRLR